MYIDRSVMRPLYKCHVGYYIELYRYATKINCEKLQNNCKKIAKVNLIKPHQA